MPDVLRLSKAMDTCEACGKTLTVGDWPWCPHGKPTFQVDAYSAPYFDYGLGRDISSNHERAVVARRMGLYEKGAPDDTPRLRSDRRDRQMAKKEKRDAQSAS